MQTLHKLSEYSSSDSFWFYFLFLSFEVDLKYVLPYKERERAQVFKQLPCKAAGRWFRDPGGVLFMAIIKKRSNYSKKKLLVLKRNRKKKSLLL